MWSVSWDLRITMLDDSSLEDRTTNVSKAITNDNSYILKRPQRVVDTPTMSHDDSVTAVRLSVNQKG